MCSVNPKSTKEPEVLNTFIWENNIVWHEIEIWGGGEGALCKKCIQFKLWYKIQIFHRPLAIWHPTELQCRRWNQSWFMERWTRKGLGISCILVDSSIIGNWIALLIYWEFQSLQFWAQEYRAKTKIPNFGRFACLSEPDIILQSESGFFEQFAGEIAGAVWWTTLDG